MKFLCLAFIVAAGVSVSAQLSRPLWSDGEFDVTYIAPDRERSCTGSNLFQSNGHLYADITCPSRFGDDYFPGAEHGDLVGQWLYQ